MGFYYFKVKVFYKDAEKAEIEQGFIFAASLHVGLDELTTRYYDDTEIEEICCFAPVTENYTDVVMLPSNSKIELADILKANFGWMTD